MKLYLLALLSVAATTPVVAQGHHRSPCDRDDGGDDRYAKYCEDRNIGWRSNGHVSVDAGPNGGVSVTGWNRDSVDVIVTVHARARSDSEAHDLASQVQVTTSGGTLHATGPDNRRGYSWWVSYEIQAPMRQDLTLETTNGPVSVESVSGVMQIEAVNGPITLDEVAGDVHARVENGPLHVTLAGTQWDGRGLDAETVNGPATLEVPTGYNADLETGTVNGPMDIGMPITVQGRFGTGRQRIHTTLGRGGPSVRVVTTNGPARITQMH